MSSYWINGDSKNRRYVLHKDSCTLVNKVDDGLNIEYNWETFDTEEEAKQTGAETYPKYDLHLCRRCYREEVQQQFRRMYRNK